MFGRNVRSINEIKEAIATYTAKAAEKLRRQYSAANTISIFVVAKGQNHNIDFRHGESFGTYTRLPVATSSTHELIKPAVELVDKIFVHGTIYKKAGVMLSGLVPDETIQGNLFTEEKHNGKRLLMSAIDNVNFAMRDDIIKFAASGTKRNWKMRMEMRSPRYTSRWDELYKVS
jgi:DNA polymerase V